MSLHEKEASLVLMEQINSCNTEMLNAGVFCDPENVPGNRNDWISLEELPLGCWTDFVSQNGTEVHLINLEPKPDSSPMFTLNVSVMNPSVLVFSSASEQTFHSVIYDNPNVTIYVANRTMLKFFRPTRIPVTTLVAPYMENNSHLLGWAAETFGGVTSFTTASNPYRITFSGVTGFQSSSLCELKPETAESREFINLDLQESPGELKSCYMNHDAEKLHIVNIPDDVNVSGQLMGELLSELDANSLDARFPGDRTLPGRPKTSRPDCMVAFSSASMANARQRSYPGQVFYNQTEGLCRPVLGIELGHVRSNNPIAFQGLRYVPKKTISDEAGEIKQMVFSYFNSSLISSYSEIRPNSPNINVWITDKSTSAKAEIDQSTPSPSSSSSSGSSSFAVPMEMHFFSSPDYKFPLDPSSKVQSDKRLYAEISSETFGEIALSIRVRQCWVQSLPVQRNMPFREEPCFNQNCSKRLSFSFETLQDLPASSWDLQCTVKLCHDILEPFSEMPVGDFPGRSGMHGLHVLALNKRKK
ncbi:hypothetical protein DNTS_026748 [Danionella cerebrum]|uniref:TGFBR3/Endoglin-like N-terminal domain-containing protein n=1 Tax=Danionella cerebrum TaxID=2873325 RepID=A0A553R6R2_9TELE|nr:hypothetical protein DNTS_026748 [Danionella translucida]